MNRHWKQILKPAFLANVSKAQIPPVTRTLHCCVSRGNENTKLVNLSTKTTYYSSIKFKSKKAQEDSDDEGDVYDDDSSLRKDSKVVKFNSTSLRTDLILKSALGLARNKIEQQFYESKIRVNGKKILKKSASVRIGDEIDMIKMVSPKNPDHLYVSRVEVLNLTAKEDNIVITARRYKNLLIENYENDPYKGNASSEH